MHGTVAKWGNSLAIRLPRHIAESARLEEGTPVDFAVDEQGVVIRPSRKRFKLADLLAQDKDQKKHGEYDWGEPKGEEVW